MTLGKKKKFRLGLDEESRIEPLNIQGELERLGMPGKLRSGLGWRKSRLKRPRSTRGAKGGVQSLRLRFRFWGRESIKREKKPQEVVRG